LFGAKKPQKNGVFGVFRSALKHFAILLFDPDDAQTYRISVQLDAQDVPTIKWAVLFLKKFVWGRKTSKKWGFWRLQVCTETLRNFTV